MFRGGAKSFSMNLRLRGLDRSKSYNIVSLTGPANAKVYPAGSLIYHGLEIKLSSAGDSELLELTPTHGAIGKGAASPHPH
ncbi:MAG: GH36 C-terminal domain-containing protein [Phycisphaerae bacterium]